MATVKKLVLSAGIGVLALAACSSGGTSAAPPPSPTVTATPAAAALKPAEAATPAPAPAKTVYVAPQPDKTVYVVPQPAKVHHLATYAWWIIAFVGLLILLLLAQWLSTRRLRQRARRLVDAQEAADAEAGERPASTDEHPAARDEPGTDERGETDDGGTR